MKNFRFSLLRFVLFVGASHLFCASLSFATDNVSYLGVNTSVSSLSPLTMSWRTALEGVNDQDSQSSGKFVSFHLNAKMDYQLAPQVLLNLNPQIRFESGSFQSVDGDRGNESGVYFREAAAHWLFATNSRLSAGALDQSTMHSDLLIGEQAFPAARAKWQMFEVHSWSMVLEAEDAIPTSMGLSTNTAGVEETPQFVSASLALNYEPNPQYHWDTRIGTFSYSHLPTAVAYQSSLRGNTVLSLTDNESIFVYNYEGVEAETKARFPVMRGWDFISKAAYLQNDKADNKNSRAYELTAGSEFFFVGRKSLEVSFQAFRIEPDAAVSYFNSENYFNNTNRIGYNIQSYINFKKYGFRIGVSYTDAEVIYLNPVQTRERSVLLKLETFYAKI